MFFISYYIIEFCGQSTKERTRTSSDTSNWIKQCKAKAITRLLPWSVLAIALFLFVRFFNVLQEPHLSGMLLFQSIDFIPKLNIFHDFLSNSAVFLLQLASSIFHCLELV
jgi:hypothetical protein